MEAAPPPELPPARAKSASPGSLRHRYLYSNAQPAASSSATASPSSAGGGSMARRRTPPSPPPAGGGEPQMERHSRRVAAALAELQSAKAALSSAAQLHDEETARLEAVEAEVSVLRERAAAMQAQRRKIETATHTTICELQSATRELQLVMEELGAETAALDEADRRRARLLQRLAQFEELQASLAEVLDSSFSSAEPPSPSGSQPAERSAPPGPGGGHGRGARVSEGWEPLSAAEIRSCLAAYKQSGHDASKGMSFGAAKQLAARALQSSSPTLDLDALVALSDVNADGWLKPTEFCLMLHLLKQVRLGRPLPARITHAEAVSILRHSRDCMEPPSGGGRPGHSRSSSAGAALSAATASGSPLARLRPPALTLADGGREDGGSGHMSEDSDAESFLPTPPGTSAHLVGDFGEAGEQVWGWGPSSPAGPRSHPQSPRRSPLAHSASDGAAVVRSLAGGGGPEDAEELQEVEPTVSWRTPLAEAPHPSSGSQQGGRAGEGGAGPGHERSRSLGATPSSGRLPPCGEHWKSPDSSFSSGSASPLARPLRSPPTPRGRLPTLRLFIEKVALDNARELEQAYFSVCLRGANGSVQVPAQDTPEALQRVNRYLIMQHTIDLVLPDVDDISGCAVFLELKYWKAKAKKVSLRAWSAMPLEPLLQRGGLPEGQRWEARTGTLNLPLYAKPLDPVRRKCKRLNSKAFDLHVYISAASP